MCTHFFNFLVKGKVFPSAHKEVKLNRNIDKYSVNAAAHAGKFNVRLTGDTEQLIKTNNITMRPNSAEFTHFLFFQTVSGTRNISRDALIAVETARELGKRFIFLHIYITTRIALCVYTKEN